MATPETNHEWPSWRYGPSGESGVFQSPEEVPEGWASHPSAFTDPPARNPAEDKPPIPLTRKQIMADLSERKVSFSPTSTTVALYDLLVSEIEKTS